MAEIGVSDIGPPRDKQDRFTARLSAQYLQWDASPVTIEWGTSRLVDENANPAMRIIKLKLDESSSPLSFPELGERRYDMVIINKTGWLVHTPPDMMRLRAMHESDVRVHYVREAVKIGAVRPGLFAVITDCEDGIILTAFGEAATLLVYAFPL